MALIPDDSSAAGRPMIVSASRRTDLPAFYADWFIARIRAGYCRVPNPFNSAQVRRVSLDPADVTALCFWTRNPKPLLGHLGELDDRGYRYVFLFTITGLPRVLEPYGPIPDQAVDAFLTLGRRLGPDRVVWRYDPVLLSDLSDEEERLKTFETLALRLQGATTRVIVSFPALYKKVIRNLGRMEQKTGIRVWDIRREPDRMIRLANGLSDLARRYGMELTTCSEDPFLAEAGVPAGGCIDGARLARIFKLPLALPKDKSQRPNCLCSQSVDIGAYDTCLHGCVYCYATRDVETARKCHEKHDPEGESLAAVPQSRGIPEA